MSTRPTRHWGRLAISVLGVAGIVGALTSCTSGSTTGTGGNSASAAPATITVAAVANPEITQLKTLLPVFEKSHPGIKVNISILPEPTLKDRVTQDIAAKSGQYDLVMLGPDQTPVWAKNGWIRNLSPLIDGDKSYDAQDLIPSVMKSLSVGGKAYALPFYAETSFLIYRKDLFQQAGLTMPADPTWDDVEKFAAKLNDPAKNIAGICLRGSADSSGAMSLATMLPAFGGQMYNAKWQGTFTTAPVERAMKFYVQLQQKYGIPGATSAGFPECLNAYSQGHAAMWYDATVAASTLEQPSASKVVGKNGYAPSPSDTYNVDNWFWTWALAEPVTTTHQAAAGEFLKWATSKSYIQLTAKKFGWASIPPGTRTSTYQIPQYLKVASEFAPQTLKALESVRLDGFPGSDQPYTGGGWLTTPFSSQVITSFGQEISAAIAGRASVGQALAATNSVANQAAKSAGVQK